MFKLTKILNSGVNVPETTILPKPVSLKITCGSALVITDGYAAICQPTTKPTHIAIENTKDGSKKVFCYEVNSDMLFETNVKAVPTALSIGDKVTLATDDNNCASYISSTLTGGVATIVDLMGASAVGDKVTVKF